MGVALGLSRYGKNTDWSVWEQRAKENIWT